MTNENLYRQIVKAMALGESDQAAELIDQVPDDAEHEFHTYVTAMFSAVVAKYFEADQSREAIDRFVDGIRHDFRKAQPSVQPLVIEGVLRAFFGEEHLMAEIDPNDQLHNQFLAIRKIVHESDDIRRQLDDYLTDAGMLMREWLAE